MSSQSSFVIPSPPQEMISEITDYASAPYKILNMDEALPRNVYYAEERNITYLYMLLKRFVNRNDRTRIIQHSNIYNQNVNKEVNYLFKVCFISRTDTETNANVAK